MKKIFTILFLTMLLLFSLQNLKAQNSCLQFVGPDNVSTTSNASIPATITTGFTSFTVEAWINPSAWSTVGGYQNSIVVQEGGTGGFMFRGGSNSVSFYVDCGGTYYGVTASTSVLNAWHHYAGVYNGSAVILYQDGVQVASTAASGSYVVDATTPIEIGNDYGYPSRCFLGMIDEVRIWSTAVSAGTISSWYNIPVTSSHPNYANLSGYYKMDNTTAGVLTATVGTNGTVTNTNYVPSNNSLFLDGSPYLTSSAYSLGFGYIAFGGSSTPQSISLAGANLTSNGTITLTAPTGYGLCLTSGGTYTGTLPITYTGTTVPATTVYVKFTPPANNTAYNGNIVVSGGGITSYNIAVTGSSIAILTEGFEEGGAFPPGSSWTSSSTSSSPWQIATSGTGTPGPAPHGGTYMAYFNSYTYTAGNVALLSTPATFLGKISFYMYTYAGAYTDNVAVYINTSPSITGGTLLGTVTPNNTGNSTWVQYTYSPSTSLPQGSYYYIFYATSAYGDDMYLDDITITAYLPCASPTNQPTALTLGISSPVSGTFTAATGGTLPDHYLVVRNTTGTTPIPVNGTLYTVGQPILGSTDTVVAYPTSGSFSDANRIIGKKYYYYVFSAIANTCLGGPIYNTTSPLTNSTTITSVAFTTAGNSTWTCPTGVTSVTIQCWGAGGGGGATAVKYSLAGGGAGGSYVQYNLPVTAGNVYNLTVGAGAAATNGGSSYFGNTTAGSSTGATVLAVGGNKGTTNTTTGTSTTYTTAASGAALTSGNVPSSGATFSYYGTAGIAAVASSKTSGGGGAGAGASGSTGGGAGGAALVAAGGNGNVGTAPGGGGSGGENANTTTSRTGGAGGKGYVAITANCTVQPANLSLASGPTSITLSYSASVNADHYLIVRNTTGTVPTNPATGTTYTVGTSTLGTGNLVVGYTTGITFNNTGLTSNTKYYYYIYAATTTPYSGGPIYLTTSPTNGSAFTTCPAPTAQATALTLTPTATNIGLSFTASASADNYLILRSTSSSFTTLPVNGTTYTAGNTLGVDTVIAFQSLITFTDNAVVTGVQYYYFVIAANSTCGNGATYLTTGIPSANTYTSCVTPFNPPTALNLTPTATNVVGSFTASDADHYLIVRSTSTTAPAPLNGTTYTAGSTLLGTETYVVAYSPYSSTVSFNDVSLTPNTLYYYYIFAANSVSCAGGPLYLTSSILNGNTTTLCGTPAAQPTILSLSSTNTTITGSFTASTGSPGADSYLVFRSTSNTFGTSLPVNLSNYTNGNVLGVNTVVAFLTGTTTFTDTALTSGTVYYYYVFAANSVCTGGPVYLTTASPLSNYISTLSSLPCVNPTNPPTGLTLTPGTSNISGAFYAATGGADNYLIIRNSTGIAPSASPTPQYIYTPGTAFDNNGDTVIAFSINTSFNDVGLNPGTHYYYYIYSSNTVCTGGPLYSTNTLNNDIYTNCISPVAQPSALTFTPGNTTIGGQFTPSANADHYLIVRSTLSSLSATPANGSSYTAGTSFGGGTIINYTSNTSFNDNGPLTTATLYYYFIYATNSTGCINGPIYLTSSPLIGNSYANNCVYPANQPTNISLTSTNTSVSGSFAASIGTPGADHYLIVRNTTGIAPVPINGTTYSSGNQLTGSTFVAYQTSTSISDATVTPSTKYFYFVYAANSITCAGSPLYKAASPLVGSSTTTGFYSATGTWICPAGVTSVNVYLWGGGGGGGSWGGGIPTTYANGGGGGGGACSVNTNVTVVPGTSYTVTVGSGGAAGSGTAAGATGGASSVAATGFTTLTAAGGTGGAKASNTANAAGGTGGTTGTGTVHAGGNGSIGYYSTGYTGNGGGAGGSSGIGGIGPDQSCSAFTNGGSGVYPGGSGGQNLDCANYIDNAGSPGNVPGGGGSGNSSYDASENGGAGGKGQVIFTVNYSCAAPSSQPTALSLTPAVSSVSGSFTVSLGLPSADHYLIIKNTSGTLNATPIDAKIYNIGDTIGSGLGTVVAYQTGTSFIDAGLTGNTQYYYYIFAAMSNCTGGGTPPLYNNTMSPLTGATTTNCAIPLAQPTALTLTPNSNSIYGTFTATADANATNYLIVRNTTGNTPTIPVNNTTYIPYTSTLGTGNLVIAYQTGTAFTDNNLSFNSTNFYFIYAVNNGTSCSGITYLTTTPLTASLYICPTPSSFTISPSSQSVCYTGTPSPITISGANVGNATLVNSTLASAPANTSVIGATGTNTPIYTGGVLQLTQNATSQVAEMIINNPAAINSSAFSASVDINIYPNSAPADGLSFNFAPDIPTTPAALATANGVAGIEHGVGTGLSIYMETYGTNSISIMWNGAIVPGTSAYTTQIAQAASGTYLTLSFSVNSSNQITVIWGGTTCFSNVALPAAYGAANKSTWFFSIATRSGGNAEGCNIKNLSIQYVLPFTYSFDGGLTYQTSNSYTPPSTAAISTVYLKYINNVCPIGSDTVTLADTTNITAYSLATQTACINGTFNPISVTSTGTSLTYQWYSNATASTTGGTALVSNGAQTNTYTPQANLNGTLYYYCVVHSSCGIDKTSPISGAFIVNPSSQPTILSLTPALNSVTGSFTPASGADSYLIFRSTASTFGSLLPVNGVTYTPGTMLGSNTVVVISASTTFTDNGLISNKRYYYYIFAANSTCSGGIAYLTASPLTNFTVTLNNTPCIAPSDPPDGLSLTPSTTSIAGTITAPYPIPDFYLVIRSTLSSLSSTPANQTTYASGELLGSGTVVSYQLGSTTAYTDNGLISGTHYYYYVYSVNAICTGGPLYSPTSINSDIYTNCVVPAAQPTNLIFNSTLSTISGSFTASSSADHFLIVRSTTNSLTATPVNGTSYSSGVSLGGGTVITYQTGVSFTDNGPLTAGTLYYYSIFASDSTGCSNGPPLYLTANPLKSSYYTHCAYPANQATNLVLTPNNTTVTGSFTASTGTPGADHYLIVRNTTSNVPTAPINGTIYNPYTSILSTGDSVIAYQTTSTLSDSRLIPATQYYYFVYAVNATSCSGGPNYLITTPLTFSTTTTSPPIISSLGSIHGCFGSTLTINGSFFNGTTTVTIGGTAVTSFTVNSASLITAIVGNGTTGTVSVTTPYGVATSTSSYTVISNPYTKPPILSGTKSICSGSSTNLTFNVTNSAGPFTLTYLPSGGTNTVITGLVNGSTISVSPITTTNYQIVSVVDANGCVADGNLIVNPNAVSGLSSWTLSTNGGSGWAATGSGFVTSYATDVKYQSVDLISNGYLATELDAQPLIYIADSYRGIFDSPNVGSDNDYFGVLTQLKNAGGTSISVWSNPTTYTTPNAPSWIQSNGSNWTTTSHSYTNYGTGVRSVYFEDAGYDYTSWAGNFGSIISGSTVKLNPVVTVVPATAISSQSTATQSQCLNGIFTPISVTATGTGLTYQWYSNTIASNNGGTTLGSANGAHTNSYTPQANASGTLYYYCQVNGTYCSTTSAISGAFIVNPILNIISQSTTGQTTCANSTFTPITVSIDGSNLTYQWYSNTLANNTGGISLGSANGAQTNSYTPQATTNGVLYYYCIVSGNCGSNVTSAISGAFIVNPIDQPTNLNLTASVNSIVGHFTPSTSADHYLILRSTLNTLSATPISGITYDINDMLGGGVIFAYQTDTNITDINLFSGIQYYYYIFAANSLYTGGPGYLTTLPLTGNVTTLMPPATNKTLMVTAMFQEYFNSSTGLMNQTLGINWDTGDLFKNFSGTTVDTVMVLIRKTNINADVVSSFPIDTVFYGVNLNNNGLITISLSAGITGYHYIEI
ncbi:MAG: LamG-like jellyroll fold domain-containing protein, partial [Bacteroidota bacterium]